MIGLILAGGKGTRLRPHTEEIPKPLIEVEGKAIIEHQISILKDKVTKIIIVTGFLEHKIRSFVSEKFPNVHIEYVHNDEYENSRPAFAIIKTLPFLNESVLYLNGDVFFESHILDLIIDSPNQNTTAIQKISWDEEEVNVIMDEKNNVLHISKEIPEEKSDGEFIGITKLDLSFIEKIKELSDLEGIETFRFAFAIDLINHVIQKYQQKIFGLDVTNLKAIEIDTLSDLNQANHIFKNEQAS